MAQTIEMFEVITQSQPQDYQSLEILKEAYSKLGRDNDVVSTSKRIAEAYVHMGQLSSAILEYETILQRFPHDTEVQEAPKNIENKAHSFPGQNGGDTVVVSKKSGDTARLGRRAAVGLYISYEIVKKHGGEVIVETAPGQGTQFRVELPFIAETG